MRFLISSISPAMVRSDSLITLFPEILWSITHKFNQNPVYAEWNAGEGQVHVSSMRLTLTTIIFGTHDNK
ncbi:MAG: hypothetical protein QM537_07785 [Candidatus Symbiobacter sp.]|nr:hypothetical protein [Candidatus Symbiobacter sp.]